MGNWEPTNEAVILVCRDGCGPLNVESSDATLICQNGHYDPVEFPLSKIAQAERARLMKDPEFLAQMAAYALEVAERDAAQAERDRIVAALRARDGGEAHDFRAAAADFIESLPPRPETYTTETGRVLTDADIERLAGEAEKGYDVSDLRPGAS